MCERWVCKENKHCFKCEACTSKVFMNHGSLRPVSVNLHTYICITLHTTWLWITERWSVSSLQSLWQMCKTNLEALFKMRNMQVTRSRLYGRISKANWKGKLIHLLYGVHPEEQTTILQFFENVTARSARKFQKT